ncbi:hypothetical protein TJA_15070 [Thermus sp. LT1-2-5]|uniref:nucleotidyltransferase domain-containing protein n=1 Tax=Thermus sp. LT1-2-5 TaxID=3026935 RepID=UPI0030E8009F
MRAELRAYLEEAAKRLKEAFALEGLYRFGSHARGAAEARSDLDLLGVAETSLPRAHRAGVGAPPRRFCAREGLGPHPQGACGAKGPPLPGWGPAGGGTHL